MRIRLCCAHVCVLSGGELCNVQQSLAWLALHGSTSCHGQRCSTHPTHNAPRLPTLARLRGEALLLKLIHRDARTPSARCLAEDRAHCHLSTLQTTSIRCMTRCTSQHPTRHGQLNARTLTFAHANPLVMPDSIGAALMTTRRGRSSLRWPSAVVRAQSLSESLERRHAYACPHGHAATRSCMAAPMHPTQRPQPLPLPYYSEYSP